MPRLLFFIYIYIYIKVLGRADDLVAMGGGAAMVDHELYVRS